MSLENKIKNQLRQLKESHDKGHENYMFFGNLQQMHRQTKLLMQEDHNMIDNILKEHDWAQDHIAEAKSLLDQVFDFLMNETKKSHGEHGQEELGLKNMSLGFVGGMMNESQEIDEGKNKPTNPKLWARAKSMAKSKFKVYPSAYANGWAAKWYKSKGGGWRKSTNESLQEEKKSEKFDVYHKSYTSAINAALDYAEKRGYEYDKEETASKIGSGPKKPDEGKTNRFTISLYKDGKEQKKSLHIQVYGMSEK
jgi:hypothetical protein